MQAARVILLRPASSPKHGFGIWLARAAQRSIPTFWLHYGPMRARAAARHRGGPRGQHRRVAPGRAGERHPEAAGFLGVPIKLDVSVPAAQWVRLASQAAAVVAEVDPGAHVITFGHVADGNVHVNIVPAETADGRHEDAVFSFVASLGGSISAEHGIGALKAPWLPLARTDAERALFARIRSALDPSGTLNPNVLPRLSGVDAECAEAR